MESLNNNKQFFKLEFSKSADVVDRQEFDGMLKSIESGSVTDLVIMSHGWNNDIEDARRLYEQVFALVGEQLNILQPPGRTFAKLGIFWPSKKFADKDLIPGGAASVDGAGPELSTQIAALKDFFDNEDANGFLEQIQMADRPGQIWDSEAEDSLYAAIEGILRPLLEKQSGPAKEDAGNLSMLENMKELLINLQTDRKSVDADFGSGSAAMINELPSPEADSGTSAGLPGFIMGLKESIANALNLSTYYQMKDRAGLIGSLGLNPILHDVRKTMPAIKIHLIGHSFGCRVVSAGIAGKDSASAVKADSLILLQGAFLHYGFALNFDGEGQNGFFRRVVGDGLVNGVTAISHTRNDKAVGIAYAIASRAARQVGAALGDENDIYGGLGSNGALKTPEANNSLSLNNGTEYHFSRKGIYNLNADSAIFGHSDITNKPVARLIAAVITI